MVPSTVSVLAPLPRVIRRGCRVFVPGIIAVSPSPLTRCHSAEAVSLLGVVAGVAVGRCGRPIGPRPPRGPPATGATGAASVGAGDVDEVLLSFTVAMNCL